MKTASWFRQLEEDTIECILCPHNCRLQDGMTGICRVRTNHSGVLMAESYGLISAIHADPVEKKPLYHYFPGRTILSIGSVGCNLRCRFCQNFEISQVSVKDFVGLISYSPGQIIEAARSIPGNIGIAYTYNEPIVGYEFMMDVSKLAGQSGLKNVLVTNGYINPDPLSGLLSCMDAFSVDLKGFSPEFYRKVMSARLEPVLKSLQQIRDAGKHLEIVNLVIPKLNEDEKVFETMAKWISENLGPETVLHLSAYFPRHLSTEPPTSAGSLLHFKEIANRFLKFVYTGNIHLEENQTLCPSCDNILVSRIFYRVSTRGLDPEGNCNRCGMRFFENF